MNITVTSFFGAIMLLFANEGISQKIYLMNRPGYNSADTNLINAISNNGYIIYINDSIPNLPPMLTTTCEDSINGYDWLCFFGNEDYYTDYFSEIKSYIDDGGKVFYQYEVNCCNTSSLSISNILTDLIGQTILPDTNNWISINLSNPAAWQGTIDFCDSTSIVVTGNAYKCLEYLPVQNQFIAISSALGSYPLFSLCPNFGFIFSTNDFISEYKNGAIVGIGDYNLWYKGNEPDPLYLDTNLVNFIFPKASTNCSILPSECILSENHCDIHMPNVFTPNNDGINDLFLPVKNSCNLIGELLIYNRWGDLLHKSEDNIVVWDGKYNGTVCSEGIYFWVLSYNNKNNQQKIERGFLTLFN